MILEREVFKMSIQWLIIALILYVVSIIIKIAHVGKKYDELNDNKSPTDVDFNNLKDKKSSADVDSNIDIS